MQIAKLNGININYKLYDHGHKQTITLVSGFACDHKIWTSIIDNLTHKFNVLVFDNRGIGLTTDDNIQFDIKKMAQDLYQLLNYLNINNAHILGHSMGGIIAQQFAIDYPQYINKLIILNSGIASFKTLEYALSNQNILWKNYSPRITDMINFILPWMFSNKFLNNSNYISEFMKNIISEPHPQSFFDHKRQLDALINVDLRDQAHKINCDTLVIGSEDDLLTPLKINQEITQYIKNSKFAIISGGHISIIESSHELTNNILTFL